jgi:hypothetical protein
MCLNILPAETFHHLRHCFSTTVPQHLEFKVFMHIYLTLVYAEWLVMKYDGTAYIGLIWFRLGTSGGVL